MARVITPDAAYAAGISPASLRAVAAWKFDAAQRAARGWSEASDFAGPDPVAAERHRGDAKALMHAAHEVKRLAGRKSRRRQQASAVPAAADQDERRAA